MGYPVQSPSDEYDGLSSFLYLIYRKIRRFIMNGPYHEYPAMRKRMSKRSSRKNFKRNSGVHPKNNRTNQRGGYRL